MPRCSFRPHRQCYDLSAHMTRRTEAFERLFARNKKLAPLTTAVVHPCDPESLRGVQLAWRRKLISPILVGPEHRIRKAAGAARVGIDGWRIIPTEHSHAAADAAVALAREGRVDCLMKGSLHTEELLGAVVDSSRGLRTARRVTHVFVLSVRTYPRPLLITDAAINIYPDLETKRDIAQNAIDLAHALGIPRPRVAVLSAVETVTPKIPSTIDAAALCKMADRGQIAGAVLDGPLAFDNAISETARRAKHIKSAVAGRPDILLVPDLEAGNMLVKQLQYLAGAQSAGIVLGARVPIVLTSRADTAQSRLASCAVAALVRAHGMRRRIR
jgi:phosphate acetyltransferase